jgi:hypothetical protein
MMMFVSTDSCDFACLIGGTLPRIAQPNDYLKRHGPISSDHNHLSTMRSHIGRVVILLIPFTNVHRDIITYVSTLKKSVSDQ